MDVRFRNGFSDAPRTIRYVSFEEVLARQRFREHPRAAGARGRRRVSYLSSFQRRHVPVDEAHGVSGEYVARARGG